MLTDEEILRDWVSFDVSFVDSMHLNGHLFLSLSAFICLIRVHLRPASPFSPCEKTERWSN